MATKTFGTSANNSLTALQYSAGADMLDADIATICANIKDDVLSGHLVIPGSWSRNGLLYIPNRGVLKLQPGDWIAVDTNSGFPIVVPNSVVGAGGTPWAHS
jgi:hypothetical protein